MVSKKYSVLMSVYQREKPQYFKDSIKSMVHQTLPPDQIVIVKDGELTNELEIVIKQFFEKYPDLITIVPLKKNVGLGIALNQGLKKCRNELIARMDTDDISKKDRCEKQIKEFFKNNSLSIVGTYIDEFTNDPNNIISSRLVPTEHSDILRFSKRRNPFNHPTVMYKKSVIQNLGGYNDFRRNQDFDLFVRILNSGYISKNINEALVLFRADNENLKRRKSWTKCKNNIYLLFNFWKSGYSGFLDFLIVSLAQVVVFISPLWLFDFLSKKILRKSMDNEKVVD